MNMRLMSIFQQYDGELSDERSSIRQFLDD